MKITIPAAPTNSKFRQSLAAWIQGTDVTPDNWASEQVEQGQRGDLLFILKPFASLENLSETAELDGVAFIYRVDAGLAMSYYIDATSFEMGMLDLLMSTKVSEAADAGQCFGYCSAHLNKPADEETIKKLASNLNKWPGNGKRNAVKDGLPDPLYFFLTSLGVPTDPTLANSPVALDELFMSLIDPASLSITSKSPKLADYLQLYVRNASAVSDNGGATDPAPAAANALRDLFSDSPAAKPQPQANALRDLFNDDSPVATPAEPKPAQNNLRDLFGDPTAAAPAAAAPAPAAKPAPPSSSGSLRDLFSDNALPKAKPVPPGAAKSAGSGLSLQSLFDDAEPAKPVVADQPAVQAKQEPEPAAGGLNALFADETPATEASAPRAGGLNSLLSDETAQEAPVDKPNLNSLLSDALPHSGPLEKVEPATTKSQSPLVDAPSDSKSGGLNSLLSDNEPESAPTVPVIKPARAKSGLNSLLDDSPTSSTPAPSATTGGLNALLSDTKPEPQPAPPSTAASTSGGGLNALLSDTKPEPQPAPPSTAASTSGAGLNALLSDTKPEPQPAPAAATSPAAPVPAAAAAESTPVDTEPPSFSVEADGSPSFEELSFKRLKTMSLNELLAKLEEQSRTARKRLQEILETHQTAFKADMASLGGEDSASENVNLSEALRTSRIELIERLRAAANSAMDSIRSQTNEAKQSIEEQLTAGTLELEGLSPLISEANLFTQMEAASTAIETALQDKLQKIVAQETKALESAKRDGLDQLKAWSESTLANLAEIRFDNGLPVTSQAATWLQNHSNTTVAKLTMLFSQEFERILLSQTQQSEEVHQGISMAEVKIARATDDIVSKQIQRTIVDGQSSLSQTARELRQQLIKRITQSAEESIRTYDVPLLAARKEIAEVEALGSELRASVQDELQKSLDAKYAAYADWLDSKLTELRTELGLTGKEDKGGEPSDDRQVRLNKLASDVIQSATTLCSDATTSFKVGLEESLTERDQLAKEATEKHKADIQTAVKNCRLQTEESINTTSARLADITKKIQELHGQFLK